MPQITFLPHDEICPQGAVFEIPQGTTVLEGAKQNGVELEHACGGEMACVTCHVVIREGFDSLEEATEEEEDCLDQAWDVSTESRLACQTKVATEDLVIQIPKYHLNQVNENH